MKENWDADDDDEILMKKMIETFEFRDKKIDLAGNSKKVKLWRQIILRGNARGLPLLPLR